MNRSFSFDGQLADARLRTQETFNKGVFGSMAYSLGRLTRVLWALALCLLGSPASAADAEQQYFRSPLVAIDAALAAARSDDSDALAKIFGPASGEILSSGDEVADQEGRRHFLEAADVRTSIERQEEDRVILSVGEDDWPFPIPLRRTEKGWYFDTPAGAEELINRRIGRNELQAIATTRAYVDAQFEYYALNPLGEETPQYAQRLGSSEDKRDGLYWPVGEEEAPSPLGPLVVAAVEQGYGQEKGLGQWRPYNGYLFRILKAQGPHAPGGGNSYVKDGRMTGGFALVAYPAEYGNSGVMTFIVNQRGILYQKDLGDDTLKLAEAMEAFDPDASWTLVGELER